MGWLAGGAGRPFEQVQEDFPPLRLGCKFGHVGDALGQRHDGGAAAEQVAEPRRGFTPGVVPVEGEEDVVAAAQGGGWERYSDLAPS